MVDARAIHLVALAYRVPRRGLPRNMTPMVDRRVEVCGLESWEARSRALIEVYCQLLKFDIWEGKGDYEKRDK